MKLRNLFLFLFFTINCVSQTKMISRNGIIHFEASVPSFEEIKGQNNSSSCVFYTNSGTISCVVFIKEFTFKSTLMEEHFNKYYLESDSYPKATFKGKLENFDFSKLSSTPKEYIVKGKINIHGKTKKIIVVASIRKVNNSLKIESNFTINTDDFAIQIPSILSNKVSRNADVSLKFELN